MHRIRVGPYRIIYSIHDKEQVVVIDKVDRRRERTYKG
ncbi:MAG: type II toxin-antitoxin system RelE/ParE family toxin [Anaerolineae bacterium]